MEARRKWVAEVCRNRQRSDMGYRLWSEVEMDQEKANPSQARASPFPGLCYSVLT